MIKLHDILDAGLLDEMIQGGFVSARDHWEFPYVIYNYTQRTTFENKWNDVTMTCRGLIVNRDTGEVIARPFRKFFNHRQPGCPKVSGDARVIVTDKMDGSLGILYPEPDGGYAIATRGSFDSEQAIRGTAMWKERYEGIFRPFPGVTMLFEIVYPENRIVLDYGYDDLVFLAANSIEAGKDYPLEGVFWPGRSCEHFHYRTFAEALAAPPRPNAEGLVIYLPDTGGERIKIKQEDYLAMHKIVCGLSERAVWEALMSGCDREFIQGLPDEFQEWAESIADRIASDVMEREDAIRAEYERIAATLPDEWSRKDFAIHASKSPDRWALFALLDGHDIRPELLKRAKPDAKLHPNIRCQSEDTN